MDAIIVCDNCSIAEFSISIPYFTGPAADVKILNEALGATVYNSTLNVYQFSSCPLDKTALPDVVFYIEGKPFPIKSQFYIGTAGGNCITAFLPDSKNNYWLFGQIFMSQYYTIFDGGHRKIGLATSKN